MRFTEITKHDLIKDPQGKWEIQYGVRDTPIDKIVGIYSYSEIMETAAFRKECYSFQRCGETLMPKEQCVRCDQPEDELSPFGYCETCNTDMGH